MSHLRHATACVALAMLVACTQQAPPEPPRRPQQAGQPLDPIQTAARMTTIRGAALIGDQDTVRRQAEAMSEDMRKAMKLPDPARRIDRESARTAARQVEGVRSANWIDRENLLVMVDDAAHRTHQIIDLICMELEPLGDTLAVVVNLQNATARNGDELEILSRNCQLAPGDRAMAQRYRQVDVIAPEVRMQRRASEANLYDAARRKARDDRANAAALEAIPEM